MFRKLNILNATLDSCHQRDNSSVEIQTVGIQYHLSYLPPTSQS